MSRITQKTAQLSPCPDGFALEHQLLLPTVPVRLGTRHFRPERLVVGLELGLQCRSCRIVSRSRIIFLEGNLC